MCIIDSNEESQIREYANIKEIKEMNTKINSDMKKLDKELKEVLHKTGDEEVTGVKNFTNEILYKGQNIFDYISNDYETAIKNKQDVLTAGENIAIVDNVISATGGFNLFDTKLSDHILEGDEAKGWALQGTYVYKEAVAGVRDGYPTFYDDVLFKKQNATATEVTLGDSTITMYITNNGYQFYDIADREVIDNWYNTYGLAWFYGVDEANERIFLPRDKYFAVKGIAPVVGNGMALGLTDGINNFTLLTNNVDADANKYLYATGAYGMSVGTGAKTVSGNAYITGDDLAIGVTTDATKSGIEAHLVPNEEKYLYICVGNTNVSEAITDIVEVTTTENDTMPLFTGMYFDFKPNNISWLRAGQQVNSGGVYTTAYNELVNCLNGTNKYNLKVINVADMVSGVDYSEYWKVNQDEMYFVCPTKLSYGAFSNVAPVVGNGMALGLTTDGTNTYSFIEAHDDRKLSNSYNGNALPQSGTPRWDTDNGLIGVSTDTTKSGIEAHLKQSTAELYFKVANAVQNLEMLNVGEVMENLTNKCDVDLANCTRPYVIEVSDKSLLPSWYRVWSDGWCEQGGRSSATSNLVVVNLLKPFIDTNYSVITTGLYDSGNTANAWDYVRNFTTSTFSIYQQEDGCVWEAKGYIS